MVASNRKFFVGGNFKMNGSVEMITALVKQLNDAKLDGKTEVVIAPPAIYLLDVKRHVTPPVQVAAQNCFTETSGAFTGEISPSQLKDAEIHWVILGHSERRAMFGDSDKLVADKTEASIKCGLSVIACVGETLEQRDQGITNEVVETQLEAIAAVVQKDQWNIVIAYEPVWAIGTGKVASPQQAQDVHEVIRAWLSKRVDASVGEATRIIYGGSVSGKNCVELAGAKDIDGFLVGGASLKPEFIDIIKSGQAN